MPSGISICRRSLQIRPFSAGVSLSSCCGGNHTHILQRPGKAKASAPKVHGRATPHPTTRISCCSLTSVPSPSLGDGHRRAKDLAKTGSMLLLTWTWRTVVPTVAFSKRLTLYRALLKMGRLSFSLMRLIFTRAKPTWSGMLSFAKSWAEKGSKGEGWRHRL